MAHALLVSRIPQVRADLFLYPWRHCMRKLLSFLACGLAAVSFSAIAADTTDVDANTKIQNKDSTVSGSTDTKADVKSDASTGSAGAGASTDVKTDKPKRKIAKPQDKDVGAGAGATTPKSGAIPPAPAAPAAPATTEAPKTAD